jgi:hypothetical protein
MSEPKPIIDYMEERNWEQSGEEISPFSVVLTGPVRRFERTAEEPASGRPNVEVYEGRRQVSVVLGKEWDRGLGKLKCALVAIYSGMCQRTWVDVRLVQVKSMWPWTPEECSFQREALRRAN